MQFYHVEQQLRAVSNIFIQLTVNGECQAIYGRRLATVGRLADKKSAEPDYLDFEVQ